MRFFTAYIYYSGYEEKIRKIDLFFVVNENDESLLRKK